MIDTLLQKVISIKDYDITIVELPFRDTVHLPFGNIKTRPSAWLKIKAEIDGVVLYGAAEGTALPINIPMYDDRSVNLRQNIQQIMNNLDNAPSRVIDVIRAIGLIEMSGNFATARMTVETAILDAVARSESASIVSYLDGNSSSYERHIPYGKSIAESTTESILTAASRAFERGAKRLKFKISPNNYSELYPALCVIVDSYPGVNCMVDANGMFDPENEEHIMMLKSIDDLQLLTIEEPVSRAGKLRGLVAHRTLSSILRLKTPVTVDDSIKSIDDAKCALDEGLADIVNLKPGRMGSFIKCLEVADYAKSRGKEVMVGGMFEATPGRMMTLSLAAYCIKQGFKIPGDVSLPQERLGDDLVEQTLYIDGGNIVFKPSSGWGYDL